ADRGGSTVVLARAPGRATTALNMLVSAMTETPAREAEAASSARLFADVAVTRIAMPSPQTPPSGMPWQARVLPRRMKARPQLPWVNTAVASAGESRAETPALRRMPPYREVLPRTHYLASKARVTLNTASIADGMVGAPTRLRMKKMPTWRWLTLMVPRRCVSVWTNT